MTPLLATRIHLLGGSIGSLLTRRQLIAYLQPARDRDRDGVRSDGYTEGVTDLPRGIGL